MNIKKTIFLISIVLISLICLSAVSAADDSAISNDLTTDTISEIQAIDNDLSQSNDLIGDEGSGDLKSDAIMKDAKDNSLGSNELKEYDENITVDLTGEETVDYGDENTINITLLTSEYDSEKEIDVTKVFNLSGNASISVSLHTIDEQGGESWTRIEELDSMTYVSEGIGSFTIPGILNASDYTVNVIFTEENEHYAAVDGDFDFTVDKAAAIVLAEAENYAYGQTGTIKVNVTDVNDNPINGTLYIEIDDEIYAMDINITDGYAEIILENLEIQSHSAEVTFSADNYRDVSNICHFNMTKAEPTLTVEDAEGIYGEPLMIPITLLGINDEPINGTAIVTLGYYDTGDVTVVYFDDEGNGTNEAVFRPDIIGIIPDTYDITVEYIGDDNYNKVTKTVTATVISTKAEIEAEAEDTVYGEPIILNVTLTDGFNPIPNAKIDITIGDYTGFIELDENGQYNGELNIEVQAGPATIILEFNNDTYTGGYTEIDINIDRAPTMVLAEAENFAYGETGTLKVNVTDVKDNPLNGKLYVEIDGEIYALDINITDGYAEIPLENFETGNYVAEVTFSADNYRDISYICHFNVTRASPTITVEDVEAEWGTPIVVPVNITGINGEALNGTAVVRIDWIVDGVDRYIEIVNGKGEAAFEISQYVAPGEWDITVFFMDDKNYDEANASAKLNYTDSTKSDMEVTVEAGKYGESTKVTITLSDGSGSPIEATLDLTLGDFTIPVKTDSEGTYTQVFNLIEAGEHTIIVSFDDGFHEALSEEVNFTVLPSDEASVFVSVEEYEYVLGDNVTVYINVTDNDKPVRGTVCLTVDGSLYGYPELTKGCVEIVLENLTVGNHEVEVSLMNPNYSIDCIGRESFNVLKATPSLKVEGSVVEWGEPATVKVTLSDIEGMPIPEYVVVTLDWIVDGQDILLDLNETNEAVFQVSSLVAPGTYDVTVRYFGNDNYLPVTNTEANVTLTPSVGTYLELETDDIEYGEALNITVTLFDEKGPIADVTVNLTIDGAEYGEILIDENGTGTISVIELNAGDHSIIVSFDDDTHAPATEEEIITVYRASGANIIVSVEDVVYGQNATAVITVKDSEDNPLTGKVSIEIDSEIYAIELQLDENGTLSVPIENLEAGRHAIEANFYNPNYLESSFIDHFTVEKKTTVLIVENMTTFAYQSSVDGNIGDNLTATLVDGNGNPLVNKTVQVGLNGRIYTRTTNATGGISILMKTAISGRYTFAVSFLGDDNYNASFACALCTVNKQTPKLTTSSKTYKASASTKNLTATFKTKAGNPLASKTIKFTVNGKTYSAKTNSKGVATVKVSLSKKGTYKFTAKYAGDDTYTAVSKNATLKLT